MEIHIQSVINVITNSSTEVFSCASFDTVELIKKIINKILKMSNIESTADDLFDIKLRSHSYQEWMDESYYTKDEIEDIIRDYGTEEEYISNVLRNEYIEGAPGIYVQVLPKTNTDIKEIQELIDLYIQLPTTYATGTYMC